jgi:hypothetical protein
MQHKSDRRRGMTPESAEKDERIVKRGMHWLQGGHACVSLALHMQQDYLAVHRG